MRESDITLTAVSNPSGMLWEWLGMPRGLSNALAKFNRLGHSCSDLIEVMHRRTLISSLSIVVL